MIGFRGNKNIVQVELETNIEKQVRRDVVKLPIQYDYSEIKCENDHKTISMMLVVLVKQK